VQPRAPLYITLLSAVLLLPCLATRMLMDDYVLAIKAAPVTRMASLPSQPLSLFTFTVGDPQRNAALMDEGALLPWWTDPHHLNAFFRPLSALTHVLDFRMWPSSAPLMHLHSVLWFCALLAALAYVYRTLEPGVALVTGLALLLYAVDDAHGATVGWIANRNALLSAALSLPALSAHHRGVSEGSLVQRWLAPLWLALGLCAGETAVCLCGYLGAYALCLDRRAFAARALSLAPYLLLLVAHQALYRALGLGSFGSSAYHDPLREPAAFARMLGFNWPVLLSAELLIPVADAAFFGDVRGRWALWGWSVCSLLALAWLFRELLRQDGKARFWALGMLLSAVPVSASLPGDRLLLALGFGAAPLLARFFTMPDLGLLQGFRRELAKALVVIHLIVAPCLLPVRASALEPLARVMDRVDAGVPRTAAVREQTVVVLNAPLSIVLSYLQIARAAKDIPRPAHLYWLSSASSETVIERTAPDTLRVTQASGFLHRPEETHYRASVHDLPVGTLIERSGMHIAVVDSTPDGRPRSVTFRFDEPLEAARYVFRTYRDGGLVPWRPVVQGQRALFAAQDFFALVAREVLR
jgi:hypothetical protein